MKIRKILCCVLAIAMICLLSSACGGEGADSGADEGNITDSGGNSGEGGGNSADNGNNTDNSGGEDNPNGDIGVDGGNNGDSNLTDSGNNGDSNSETNNGGDSENNSAGGDSSGNGSDNSDNNTSAGGGGESGSGGGNGSGGGESGSGGGDSGNAGGGDSSSGGGGESGSGGGAAGLSGTPVEVLEKLVAEIQGAGVGMPMTLPPTEVTPDLSQSIIGLSEADFGKLVASAAYNLAAIGTFAHQIIVVKAKDAASAAEVKKLICGENGYDVYKWICVWPKKAAAVESGEYVLLVASENAVVDEAMKAFEKLAGSIGTVNNFWEHTEGDAGGGGFGGGGFPIGDLPIAG